MLNPHYSYAWGVASIGTLLRRAQESPNSPAVAAQDSATQNTQENPGIEKIKNIRTRCSPIEAHREAGENNLVLISDLFHIHSTLDLLLRRTSAASGRSN